MLRGNVLLTGGSGFLGRAIIRRATRENWPCKFTVYSRDEEKQWQLKRRYPSVRCVLGDISRDLDKLTAVASGHDSIIHMGAVKFIPEAEHNVLETIDVNINGSRNVAAAAISAGVECVVGISTDKACAPINIYGMTKAIMERMFSEFARRGKTNFVTCRYGNVVGSTGSVIPVFKQQIQDFGEIRITEPSMTRFWLSIDAAIDLICWAHEEAKYEKGNVFISDCPSMTIEKLAQVVWKLVDPTETREWKIKVTGIRPGEKIHESLFSEQEAPRVKAGRNGYIMVPPIEKLDRPVLTQAYTSDVGSQVSVDEMIRLIKDAETV